MDRDARTAKHRFVPNLSIQRRSPALVALGSAIRRAREAASISQERSAPLAEVDRSYIGRIEGKNAVTVLTLIRLAAVLGMSAPSLMEHAGL